MQEKPIKVFDKTGKELLFTFKFLSREGEEVLKSVGYRVEREKQKVETA